MKKILLASTALVIGAAVQANAAEPLTASVGGYMNMGVAVDDREDGLGVLRDGEIHFKFSGTSDNGLTFDGRVELEAFTDGDDVKCKSGQFVNATDTGQFVNSADTDLDELLNTPTGVGDVNTDGSYIDTVGYGSAINSVGYGSALTSCEGKNGDQIDENWVRVSGSFGSIKIGGDDSAKNAYANGILYAPSAFIGYYDGFGWVNPVQPGISGGGDYIGIHYDSPDFSGFRFGATYQPNRDSDGANDTGGPVYNLDGDGDNFWAVGAVYSGDFNGFGVGVSAGYADSDGSDMETWHVGGNVSSSGFTLAVHYEDNGGAGLKESTDLAIGLQYATGPWTIAGGWAQQDFDASGAPDPQVIAGWVTYAVAPGVKATVGFEYGDTDDGEDEVLGGMAYLNFGF